MIGFVGIFLAVSKSSLINIFFMAQTIPDRTKKINGMGKYFCCAFPGQIGGTNWVGPS